MLFIVVCAHVASFNLKGASNLQGLAHFAGAAREGSGFGDEDVKVTLNSGIDLKTQNITALSSFRV